jgi:hypothetical protein
MVSARPRDRILTTATAAVPARRHRRGRGQPHHRPGRRGPDDPLPPVRRQGRAGRGHHRAVERARGCTGWPDAMDRRGDDPCDRFDGLWDELEAWFAEDGFRGSFVANAATELRSEPDHPAQAKIVQHRQALRQLWRTWPSARRLRPGRARRPAPGPGRRRHLRRRRRPRPHRRHRRPQPGQGRRHAAPRAPSRGAGGRRPILDRQGRGRAAKFRDPSAGATDAPGEMGEPRPSGPRGWRSIRAPAMAPSTRVRS